MSRESHIQLTLFYRVWALPWNVLCSCELNGQTLGWPAVKETDRYYEFGDDICKFYLRIEKSNFTKINKKVIIMYIY